MANEFNVAPPYHRITQERPILQRKTTEVAICIFGNQALGAIRESSNNYPSIANQNWEDSDTEKNIGGDLPQLASKASRFTRFNRY